MNNQSLNYVWETNTKISPWGFSFFPLFSNRTTDKYIGKVKVLVSVVSNSCDPMDL